MLTLEYLELPDRLRQLPQPPKKLFIEGGFASLLSKPCVGIVGSRKLSPYGRHVTTNLAKNLAQQGVTIISGLALGVDSVAHQASLDAGGATLAVLPSSLQAVYPASHRQLAKAIVAQGGGLISEYPEGSFIHKGNFIARNRIIAALSDVLLVPEAALKSGSLHTARFALEQGKDVLAVPGNITSLTSQGTNNLLKAGAGIVRSYQDVLQALGIESTAANGEVRGDTDQEQIILDLLLGGLTGGQALFDASQLPIDQFSQSLTMLEINGKVRSLGNNNWTL